jgi:hypothetical protein
MGKETKIYITLWRDVFSFFVCQDKIVLRPSSYSVLILKN